MTQKQHDKHHAAKFAVATLVAGNNFDSPTPDGLGKWQGGPQALKSSKTWVAEKSHTSRTADAKNAPGTNSHLGPNPIKEMNQKDFSEVHVDDNGEVFLYNVETDKWDIKGDSADIPLYEDEKGWLWAYNCRTGKWDVPVTEVYDGGIVMDEGDTIATAVA